MKIKMKKIAIILCCAILALGADAQIYRSVSRKIERIKPPKEKRVYDNDWGHDWFIKAGAGVLIGDIVTVKYDVKGGYRKQIHGSGLYFGGQIGLTNAIIEKYYRYNITNNGFSKFDDSVHHPALLFEPMFGIKYRISNTTSFDAHIACGYERVLSTESATDIWANGNLNRLAAEIGIGFWFNRFFVGLETQNSFSDYQADFGVAANLGFRF